MDHLIVDFPPKSVVDASLQFVGRWPERFVVPSSWAKTRRRRRARRRPSVKKESVKKKKKDKRSSKSSSSSSSSDDADAKLCHAVGAAFGLRLG